MRVASGSGERVTILWGGPGTGKSHLLQAACRHVQLSGASGVYLPLAANGDLSFDWLEGLEASRLVCLDDVGTIAARRSWERAIFDLYNRTEQTGTRLLISVTKRLSETGFALADLHSRLASGLAFQLRDLSDGQREAVLRARARERGFEIPVEVAEFLLKRYPRDMHALIGLLDRLDRLTLEEQRRVTIPFVKEVLG